MYYLISFTYKCVVYYAIWFSDEEDFILVNENKIIFFHSVESALEYAFNNKLFLSEEKIENYNIDAIIMWCKDLYNLTVDCEEILNFWNICLDAATGLNRKFLGNEEKYDELYEKIFLGSELSVEEFKCDKDALSFTEKEIQCIKKIILDGVNIITKNL